MDQEIMKKYAHQGEPCRHCDASMTEVPPGPCVGRMLQEIERIENFKIQLSNYEKRFEKLEFFISHIYTRLQHHKLGDVRNALSEMQKLGENSKGISFKIKTPVDNPPAQNDKGTSQNNEEIE